MKKFLFPFAVLVLSCMVLAVTVKGVFAQSYPNKPINLIVAWSPGGLNDILARIIAQKLTESLGQQVVVLNKPGAEGAIGTEMAAKAAPDGYTLFWGASGELIITPLIQKVRYDSIKDFEPISLIDTSAFALIANSSLPVKSVKELIALAKSKPGQINFGSGSSILHVTTEMFQKKTGVNMPIIPYKGTGPTRVALLGGEVSVMFESLLGPLLHIKAGKLRALAFCGAKRSSVMPDLPTMAESGVPFEASSWASMLAPAGTPKEIIKRLNSEIVNILRMPSVIERLSTVGGVDVVGSTPEALGDLIKAELEMFGKVVKVGGLK